MILDEIKNIKETPNDLKKFGITIGVILLIISAYLFWVNSQSKEWFLIIGVFFILAGIIFPSILRPFNKGWMTLAIVLGFIMTKVILSLLFFLVVTPIAWIAKLAGHKFLDLEMNNKVESYWVKRTNTLNTAEKYEKQY